MDVGRHPTHPDWHALPAEQALTRLQTSSSGLADTEARARLARVGPNALPRARPRPAWRRLLAQLANLLVAILLTAAAISLALGETLDTLAIVGVVTIIALIGFLQEGRAEQALARIHDMLSPRAQVLRDGRRTEIDAEMLVPGDIVLLESGDRVPADLRLLEARRLRHQEAALTGESVAVDKDIAPVATDAELGDRASMAYAGTLVAQGSARGVVVATGTATELGRISTLLGGVEKLRTPLLRQLDRAGRVLAGVILASAVATALAGILIHDSPWPEMFMAAVGLAVAAIPEGLPAIVTIGLALGVQAMARCHAIVRRLPAVETLGAVSTIFTDKTGTLTRNEMTARTIWLPEGEIRLHGVGYAPHGALHAVADDDSLLEPLRVDDHPTLRHFLRVGVLCNDAELVEDAGEWRIHGDPTEGALVVAAAKAGLTVGGIRDEHDRHDAIPFASERRYMATLHRIDGAPWLLVKGAPDRLLTMCQRVRAESGEVELDRPLWEARLRALSSRGLRVLALAEKPVHDPGELSEAHAERGLVLLGLVGLLDPPREEAITAVAECRAAGIRPVMVTGDHADTARAVAKQLGFARPDRALSGHELDAMSAADLAEAVRRIDVFARTSPEHKLRLVEAQQSHGEICAMTGDGVNDGPALRRADVGVAMGRQGTAAAREAAEVVLADDNFATIVAAVREGRKVHDNIRKTLTFLLPTNGAQGLAIMLAVLSGSLLPVTPLQALWVNMVVAATLGLALAFEPGEADLMQRPPRRPDAALLDLFLLWRVGFVAALLLLATYGIFAWIHGLQAADITVARAGAVNMLVAGCAAYLINSRRLTRGILSRRGLFGSRAVWVTIGLVAAIQLAWTYLPLLQRLFGAGPLGLGHWAAILASAVLLLLIVEAEKALLRRRG
ncbi:cation-translocating P-type ATPase [Halomonas organivorans]|uniref:Magnesium-transporting ATPase (P-type) n=1 Tax=Halomonas organivorans TaxID=257772 RepID=A0A7W5BX97_9GAMM|nr:HAD-IC family P-type ATPase [Halomonas organivorans]MBB3140700.1 magnesium-transporting ATPase (P-type) [Halomonas organivorans]